MNKKLVICLIIFGFLISVSNTLYNYNKYDFSSLDTETNTFYHQMIKYDAYRYWEHGNYIKKQLDSGVPFFKTGKENYTKYLPPRLNAFYLFVINDTLFENYEKKIIKKKIFLKYLIFQNIFYYLSLIFLFFSIQNLFNFKIIFSLISFLSFEPTLMQYHSSFWSESIFFSIQVFALGILLKNKKIFYHFIFLGISLGLLSLQKQYAFFLIIPIIIYFLFIKTRLLHLFILTFFYFSVISIAGLNNFKRSGNFYILTADTKIAIHIDLVSKVMSKKLNISNQDFRVLEGKYAKEWIKINRFKLPNQDSGNLDFLDYRKFLTEANKVKFDNHFRNRSIGYIKENPFDFAKFIFKSAIHTVLLNPFHIYSDNNFRSGEIYYGSDTHQKLIIPRMIYTSIIYFFVMIGVIQFFKRDKVNFYLISIIFLYFYGLVSWHGNTRYFVPCLIYLAFYFSFGFDYLAKLLKKNI